MSKKLFVLVSLLVACIMSAALTPSIAGKHYGELRMIEADIAFLAPQGQCIADATGITYIINGTEIHKDVVYPAEYWGTYPLYLPGHIVPINVIITNLGPRSVAKHTIVNSAYVINPDGSQGAQLLAPQVTENIEVALGETQTIPVSIILPTVGQNLNMFSAKLYHHYDPDSPDASMILDQKAVFCPPELLQ